MLLSENFSAVKIKNRKFHQKKIDIHVYSILLKTNLKQFQRVPTNVLDQKLEK